MKLAIMLLACLYLIGCSRHAEELKQELALMQSSVQTGVTRNELRDRLARLRAAYTLCSQHLSNAQRNAYESIDEDCLLCIRLWNYDPNDEQWKDMPKVPTLKELMADVSSQITHLLALL
jgi:hypothetical protein